MKPVTNAANPMMGQVKGQSPTNRAANTTSLVTFEPNQLSDGLLGLIESSQQQVGLSRDQLAQVVEMSSKGDKPPTKGPFVFEIEGETIHNIKISYTVGGAQVEINLEDLFQNHVESITTCIQKIKDLLTEVFNFLRILSDQKLIKLDDPNSSSKFEPATQFFGLKLDDASFIDGFKKGQINIGDIRFGLTSIRTFTGLFHKKYDQLIEEDLIKVLTGTFNFNTSCFTKCEDEDEDEYEDDKVYYEVNAATFTEEVLSKIDNYKNEFLKCIQEVSDGSVTGNLLQQIHQDFILYKRPTDLADMKRYENEAFTEFCYLGLNFINKQLEGICEEVGAANKYYKFAAQTSNGFYKTSVRQLQDLIATHIKPKFDPSYKEVKRKETVFAILEFSQIAHLNILILFITP